MRAWVVAAVLAAWSATVHADAIEPCPAVAAPVDGTFAWPLEAAPTLLPHLRGWDPATCGAPSTRYAELWCARDHADLRTVLGGLEALAASDRGPVGRAAGLDVATALADQMTPEAALRWLAAASAAPERYDQVGAILIEWGRGADALVVLRERPADHASMIATCQRVDVRTRAAAVLRGLDPNQATPTDEALADEFTRSGHPGAVRSPGSPRACYWLWSSASPADELRGALAAWSSAASAEDWLAVSDQAKHALVVTGGLDVALAALRNARRVGGCAAVPFVALRAEQIAAQLAAMGTRDPRLRPLLAVDGPGPCGR